MHRIAMTLTLALVACGSPGAPGTPGAPLATATAAASQEATVARIVFVDKEVACQCTQDRIDAGWAALTDALGGRALPIERLHMDTQADAVEPWRKTKPFMALPAAYLLGPDGALVTMLQGEWTRDQMVAALGAGEAPTATQ